jgi:hypothetical protein
MRGAIVVDVGAKDLEAARMALARAVASGALGTGYAVRREGDGVSFEGADGGRIMLAADGRASFEVGTRRAEIARIVEAVVAAAAVSATATLGWSLMVHQALLLGGAVGVGYAIARIVGDRRRRRRRIQSLLRSLPVLLGA